MREDGAKNRRPARGAVAGMLLARGYAYLVDQPTVPNAHTCRIECVVGAYIYALDCILLLY